MNELFPRPWQFVWKDHPVPKILDAKGTTILVLSTGTFEGSYDSKDIINTGEEICRLINYQYLVDDMYNAGINLLKTIDKIKNAKKS